MSKILVIGAGGVGSVAVHKMGMNSEIFSEIHLASRSGRHSRRRTEPELRPSGPLEACRRQPIL